MAWTSGIGAAVASLLVRPWECRVRGSSGLCMCANTGKQSTSQAHPRHARMTCLLDQRTVHATDCACVHGRLPGQRRTGAEQRRRLVLCLPVLAWSLSSRVGRPVYPGYMYRDMYHHRHRTTLHHPQRNIPPSRRKNKSHGPMPRAAWGRATSGALKSLAPELLKPRGKPERCRVPVTVRLFLVSAVAPVEDAPQSTHPQPPAPVISRRRRGGLRVCAMRG